MNISKKAAGMPASAIRRLVPIADKTKERGIKVYHLNVGAPDIKSPRCAMDAVIKKCNELEYFSYTNSAGIKELREGIALKYYKSLGIELTIDNVLINLGGTESYAEAIKIVSDPGDQIITIEPFYTNYQTFCYEHGVDLVAVHSDIKDGFKVPDISQWESVLTSKTKAVLISNPSNPSGKLFTKEDMLSIGAFCAKHDLFLICDEVYREFCYTEQKHFSALEIPGLEQNVIVVDSFSKRYNLCGVRVGCIVSRNKDVMAAALKYGQARICPPLLGQYAALGALDTPQEYFDAVNKEYIKRRDFTIERLNSIPGVFAPKPLGAFYAIASLPVEDAADFAKWLLEEYSLDGQTVMLTPIASFYKTEGCAKNQVRIAYVLELDQMAKALDILEAALEAYKN